ncbi:response regulator [Chloracidobacterium validum]|uniref:Response regulator n=1 Tax=Chloracidobacterium validum TaxID=2821543 RepID=A0ABX8BCF9_9BACT|nr:response regulator [Chloracidobacterium validum]QUW03711.1 response regulator [Chloracidobacterium validum]
MSRRILIADDHIPTRRDLQAFFQQQGFEVVAVGNGDLAARRAGEMRPDLVVLDVLMPGKTGYEACRHIKQVLKLELPILMIHHEGEPFDRTEATRVGADETLIKPIDPFALLETVNALWRKYGQTPIGFESGDFSQEVQEEDLEAAFGNGQAMGFPTTSSDSLEPRPPEDEQQEPEDEQQEVVVSSLAPPDTAHTGPTSSVATPLVPEVPDLALPDASSQPVAAEGPTTAELPDPYSVVASGDYADYFTSESSSPPSPVERAVSNDRSVSNDSSEERSAASLGAIVSPETVIDQALPFTDPYPSTNFFAPIPTQTTADVNFSVPEHITAELPPPDPAAGLSIRFDTGNAAVHIGGLYEVTEVELPESNTQEILLPSDAPTPVSETLDEADVSSDGLATEEVELLQKTGTDILTSAVIVAVAPTTEPPVLTVPTLNCPHCGGNVLESDILCPHCGEML